MAKNLCHEKKSKKAKGPKILTPDIEAEASEVIGSEINENMVKAKHHKKNK
ncbi:hypothetical protein [Cetobacterium sp. SF1]|uniref:hypothetical protein n=1 Tax=unclassified Cetobacterium TaxID=2630983 RepID=UPI003CF6A8CD